MQGSSLKGIEKKIITDYTASPKSNNCTNDTKGRQMRRPDEDRQPPEAGRR